MRAYTPTRYEIVAQKGGVALLVAYTSRRSLRTLVRACQAVGRDLLAALGGLPEDSVMTRRSGEIVLDLSGWTIRYSGRTQREAELEGELPWVRDLAKKRLTCHV